MSSQSRKTLLAVFIALLVTFEVIAYIAVTPRQQDHYFQLYLLGTHHTVSDYFPDNYATVGLGQQIAWYLGAVDDMGTVQFVSIRVKISNQSFAPPEDQQPSPAPTLTEFLRFLRDNETWSIPFVWRISNITMNNHSIQIISLNIDNQTFTSTNWSATQGYNFRLIFELWTWSPNDNAFEFGWTDNGQHQVAWLQMWFNVTTTPVITE